MKRSYLNTVAKYYRNHLCKYACLSYLKNKHLCRFTCRYSALHVQGKRLYEYARENRPLPVEIKPRPVHIHRLELLEFNPPHAVFKVECGGGTYMRSLVHDMGLDLQCYAYMSGLLRTRQGDMTLENALPLVDQEGKKCLQMSSILKAMQ